MRRVSFLLFMGMASYAFAQTPSTQTSNWRFLGATSMQRQGSCAVQLMDGRLMLAGGAAPEASVSVGIMDASGNFSPAASLDEGRAHHACAVLPDGSVLLTGGTGAGRIFDEASIYSPETNQWTSVARMNSARMGHTATPLTDGRILIAGGENASGALDSLELFDPGTGRFTTLGAMSSRRKDHAAALLPDGKVLLAGGANESGVLAVADLFDPATGSARLVGRLTMARAGLSANVLADGSVLLAGGSNGFTALASAEIFDPATGASAEASPMTKARAGHFSLLSAANGAVILVGGDGPSATAELFQSASARSAVSNGPSRQAPAQAQTLLASAGDVAVRSASPGVGSATLDQCANGAAVTPGVIGTSCVNWVNGNLNGSKASYREGDSVAYRLRMTGIPTSGTQTLTIEWDTTQSGKHALDYLTTFNSSVTNADPCVGGVCPAVAPTTTNIGIDPNIANDVVGVMAPGRKAIYTAAVAPYQVFTMWGGTVTEVKFNAMTGTATGNSSTSVTLKFTATQSNPVLAWAGHIGTRVDWGSSSSAVAISGSPFHTRLNDLNGSGGNQDRALSNDAADFPVSIKITKVLDPAASVSDGQFGFGISPALPQDIYLDATGVKATATNLGAFSLAWTTAGVLTATRTFDDIYVGASLPTSYTISENPSSSWKLKGLSCQLDSPGVSTGGTVTTNFASASATFSSIKEGDSYSCVFTNELKAFTVTVNKACVPTDDGGKFKLKVNGVLGAEGGCGVATQTATIAVGTAVTVDEEAGTNTSLSNYSGKTFSCTGLGDTPNTTGSFNMPANNVTCTITNTRQRYQVTLTKACVDGAVDLTINGGSVADTKTQTAQPCGASITQNVYGGRNVSISEAAADLSPYVTSMTCTGATLGNKVVTGNTRSGTFTMPDGAVSCTITNSKPDIYVVKSCAVKLDSTFSAAVVSTGQVCNRGPVDVSITKLEEYQLDASMNAVKVGTASVTNVATLPFTLASGTVDNPTCVAFTVTEYKPTASFSGACTTDSCTVVFKDKVVVTGTAGGGTVTVTAEKDSNCSLCKP